MAADAIADTDQQQDPFCDIEQLVDRISKRVQFHGVGEEGRCNYHTYHSQSQEIVIEPKPKSRPHASVDADAEEAERDDVQERRDPDNKGALGDIWTRRGSVHLGRVRR